MSSKLAKDLLDGKSYGQGRDAAMLDLRAGGQMGYAPDYPGYINNAAYVQRNIIPFLIQPPRGFKMIDKSSPNKMIETLKALVELHAKSIEGLQSTLNVEFSENPFGGAGEVQEDIVNVTRDRSNPSFTWVEKYGKPINIFLEYWITELMMDPATKYPGLVTSMYNLNKNDQEEFNLLPDVTGATMLFVEPDPTHTKVINAWLCTNMMPKSGGENTGRRDLTAGGETKELSIEFTAITQVGKGVRTFAQQMLDKLSNSIVNPNQRPAFMQSIDEDTVGRGYAESVKASNAAAAR